MAKYRTYSPDFKLRCVMEILAGHRSAADVCREHQLTASVLDRWREHFQTHAVDVFVSKKERGEGKEQKIADLERAVGRLTLELEVSKKASLLFHGSNGGR